MADGVLAVNARYLTQPLTGVQRYATEVVARLARSWDGPVSLIVPPGLVTTPDALDPAHLDAQRSRWSGARGHLWEQFVLPGLVARARADVLLCAASSGPLAMRRQVVVLHDASPVTHPEHYRGAYARWAQLLMRGLARRADGVVAPSAWVADELTRFLGAPAGRVDVARCAVGAPFDRWPVSDTVPAERCVFVGAHDPRKNLEFLVDLWPEVHASTGLELHAVRRSGPSPRAASRLLSTPGLVHHVDPSDEELAALYAGAMCVLSPSVYEGFGFPLLEAMAVGTPFLSTPTGAAPELALDDGQLLPLEPERWVERLRAWAAADLTPLRRQSAERARRLTWDASTASLEEVLRRTAARRRISVP